MAKLREQEMFRAMENNDLAYDGLFYVGVLSTGIYCLPSCKAKTPKRENINFFGTREEALAAGLRGCKRCHSEKYPDILPDWLKDLLSYMHHNRDIRLTEKIISQIADTDISTIRRYFNSHLGITPMAFHRKIRLQFARQLLLKGQNYITVAYDCGYESASGFRDAFAKMFGSPPGRYNGK